MRSILFKVAGEVATFSLSEVFVTPFKPTGLISKIQVRPLTYFVFLVINGIGRTLTSCSWLWVIPQAELRDKSILVIKERGITQIPNTCNKLSTRNPWARMYLQNVLKANTDFQMSSGKILWCS